MVWVAIGGAAGSVARYLIGTLAGSSSGIGFPWFTFVTNITGCFAIGLVWALMQRQILDPSLRFFLITGILGGFTTFSAFGLETFQLLQTKHYFTAMSYMVLTNIIGLLVLAVGHKLFSA